MMNTCDKPLYRPESPYADKLDRCIKPNDYVFLAGDHEAGWSVGDEPIPKPELGAQQQQMRHVYAGLLLDSLDKPEPCNVPYMSWPTGHIDRSRGGNCDYAKGHAGPHGFHDRHAPGGKFEWIRVSTTTQPDISDSIESFTRWLAKPTLAERYEGFRSRMRELLEPYAALSLSFDCDAVNGPVCRVRHPMFTRKYGCDWYGFNDGASDETVMSAVRIWAEDIGREALRKR